MATSVQPMDVDNTQQQQQQQQGAQASRVPSIPQEDDFTSWTADTKWAKSQIRESDKPMKISEIQFCLMKPDEMRRLAHCEVVNNDLYVSPTRIPQEYGPLDARLGTTNKKQQCKTCSLPLEECVGHFGVIHLNLPVFHIGYFKTVVTILQCICKRCCRVLMIDREHQAHLRLMRKDNYTALQRQHLFRNIVASCKRQTRCPHCGAIAGSVRKVGALKLQHEVHRGKKRDGTAAFRERRLANALADNPELEPHLDKVHTSITALMALHMLRRISPEDCELLNMRPEVGRPEDMILTTLLVPPVCLRPSVTMAMSSGTNEDDLTVKLGDIVHLNNVIADHMKKGSQISQIRHYWDYLQLQCASYINADLPGVPASIKTQMKSKSFAGFCQRMKGKTGRFRGNLSGKRVDFSSRTVISPDPNIAIYEVAVPSAVAKILTYPERVTKHNRSRLREAIKRGPHAQNGANYIITKNPDGTERKYYVLPRVQDRVDSYLKLGCIVERHLRDGDMVLFNRQPSLHKVSIMCHRARIMPWRTFRLNLCVCNPYNADFDGDEMNMHVPQTEEARAEAEALMGVQHNIVTPRSGDPLVSPLQDFITASFLVTKKDLFLDRGEFCQICSYFADATEPIELPPPAILKPMELWTGKQVFSMLLNPTRKKEIFVNFEAKTKSFSKGKIRGDPSLCPNDGYCVFRNSQLICGVADKKIVGSGSKSSLFYVVRQENGVDATARCMLRLSKFCARWLANYGFSIGISDVMPSPAVNQEKARLISEAYEEVNELIAAFENDTLAAQPGCSPEDSLEMQINKRLSDVRSACGAACLRELKPTNAPLIMAMCGSKGSDINISQMVACVGQQTVSGSRVPDGFLQRSLPLFPKRSRLPEGKGFVANSFFSGLTPTEFVFHTMGGREGLVDTAVKTADTGYMQRRLMKALEDLSVQYDQTVRNSQGGVIQFAYGGDNLDPADMEGDSFPVNFARHLGNARTLHPFDAGVGDTWLTPAAIVMRLANLVSEQLAAPVVERTSNIFQARLVSFVLEQISEMVRTNTSLGLDTQETLDAASDACQAILIFLDRDVTLPEDTAIAMCGTMNEKIAALLVGLDTGDGGYGGGGAAKMQVETVAATNASPEIRAKIAAQVVGLSNRQLDAFIDSSLERYHRTVVEAGTAVGALGAQSIGEPGTQMTLKTFHFAGVASMNVTLGVPRIREIINASKKISTPIITAALQNNQDERAARVVKGRVEVTRLGEICKNIRVWVKDSSAFAAIELDEGRIQNLCLDITPLSVKHSLTTHLPKLKLKPGNISCDLKRWRVFVMLPEHLIVDNDLFFGLQQLKTLLPTCSVCGIPSVERAVISHEEGAYKLLVEGYDLQSVMGTPGVTGEDTVSNHIIEMGTVLGIEAARETIIEQIDYTMGQHGMAVDRRHLMLLADLMSFRGEILGITRFGIGKMKNSTLMLASFEKTTDILFNAAVHHRVDRVVGVSECIIMGIPIRIGTGIFKILYTPTEPSKKWVRRHKKPLMFQSTAPLPIQ